MIPKKENLFASPPSSGAEEHILSLFKSENTGIECIASYGHPSPPDFWYDQPNSEWVILLEGTATLEFSDNQLLELKKGDYTLIPANLRHRVQIVSSDALWLAVHLEK